MTLRRRTFDGRLQLWLNMELLQNRIKVGAQIQFIEDIYGLDRNELHSEHRHCLAHLVLQFSKLADVVALQWSTISKIRPNSLWRYACLLVNQVIQAS